MLHNITTVYLRTFSSPQAETLWPFSNCPHTLHKPLMTSNPLSVSRCVFPLLSFILCFGYQSFSGYMCCKDFCQECGFLFLSLNSIFCRAAFNFSEAQLILFSSHGLLSSAASKRSSPDPRTPTFSSMVTSTRFISFAFYIYFYNLFRLKFYESCKIQV